jgi:hypothetical protein
VARARAAWTDDGRRGACGVAAGADDAACIATIAGRRETGWCWCRRWRASCLRPPAARERAADAATIAPRIVLQINTAAAGVHGRLYPPP